MKKATATKIQIDMSSIQPSQTLHRHVGIEFKISNILMWKMKRNTTCY